ncbi:MAG: MarR family winged helix-turn-helix transcriptional regulator [Blautia sp.]
MPNANERDGHFTQHHRNLQLYGLLLHQSGRSQNAGKVTDPKPAVSYILNTLEKKNYITREIDPKDRRKISISATPEGVAAAELSMKKYDEIWTELLTRFGEENMRKLTELLTDLNELYRILSLEFDQ